MDEMIGISTSSQAELLGKLAAKRLSAIYEKENFLKITFLPQKEQKYAEKIISRINVIYSLIELNVMSDSPRRVLHYFCMLDKTVRELEKIILEFHSYFP